MLPPHAFWYDLEGKAARLARAPRPNPVLDPGELRRHLEVMERDLEEAVRAQQRAPD